jgi:hypothetical protein
LFHAPNETTRKCEEEERVLERFVWWPWEMQKGKAEQKREKKIPVAVRLSFAAPRLLMPGNAASIPTGHH